MNLFDEMPEQKKEDPNAITRDQIRQLEDFVGVTLAGEYMAYREQHKGIKQTRRAMNAALNKLRKMLDPINAVTFGMKSGWSGLHGIELKEGQHQRVPPFDEISSETKEATRRIEEIKRKDDEHRERVAAKLEKQGVTYTTEAKPLEDLTEEEMEARKNAALEVLNEDVADIQKRLVEEALKELE